MLFMYGATLLIYAFAVMLFVYLTDTMSKDVFDGMTRLLFVILAVETGIVLLLQHAGFGVW